MPKVIDRKYLPQRSPVPILWLIGLTLYTLDASTLLWGIYIGLTTVFFLAYLITIGNEQPVHPEDIA